MNSFNALKKQKKWLYGSIALFFCLSGFMACSGSKESDQAKNSSANALSPAMSTSGEPQASVEPETQESETDPQSVQEETDQPAGELDNYFSAIEDSLTRIPRETFDPEAVVQRTGQDPVKLFEWVRDETAFVPYRGSLRGPIGMLMDRRGNSLDRALILHELLSLTGNEVRLARGRLPLEKAKAVYQKNKGRNLAPFNPRPVLSLPDQRKNLEIMAQKYQLHQKDLLNLLTQSQQAGENEAREISEQAKEQTAALLDIVNDNQKEQPKKPAGPEYEALEDHWWVQWEKDGTWEDLDPTLQRSQPGETLAEAEETYAPDDLEEELIHTLTIRAIVEQWKDGRLDEQKILEHLIIPSKMIGKPIVWRQLPVNWPSDKQLFGARNPMEALRSAVMEQDQWKAALEIDGKAVAESYFTAQGDVTDEPVSDKARKKKEEGTVGGLFGALAGGEEKGEQGPAAQRAHLTAEWLEYEIHSPGQPVQIIRREVFNLLEPSVRKKGIPAKLELSREQQATRNFKILNQTEILPLVCRLSPAQIETMAAENMLLDQGFFQDLQEKYRSLAPQDVLTQFSELRFLRGELYGLALKRFEFSATAPETYLDSPNLFAFHSSLGEDEKGEPVGSQCLDIVVNDVSVSPAAKEDPFRVQLEQGVLETVLEAREMSDQGKVINAANIFAEAKAQEIDWLLVENAGDPNWKRVELPPAVRARIEEDLSGGHWVIAPVRQVLIGGKPESAWWRLNPQTGNILGAGENGMGQAMTQYAVKVNIVLQLKTAIQIYADIMRCMATAITSPLRGARPQHDELTIKCIWDLVCKNGHKAAKSLLTIEVNWTNIIISQTISWLVGKFCAALWDKGINR
jgi:hypothetical protein